MLLFGVFIHMFIQGQVYAHFVPDLGSVVLLPLLILRVCSLG